MNPGYFLEGVERAVFDGQTALIARPLRALLDRCCQLRLEWSCFDDIMHNLRIDPDDLEALRDADWEALRPLYRHQRMRALMDNLHGALTA